jgi:chemotaxis signal transduction protein
MGPTTRQVLIFRIGPYCCSLPAGRLHEIVHRATLLSAPGQPSILAGFLNLRGVAVPVVRMSKLFGFDALRVHPYMPLIILRFDRMLVALEADAVDEVAPIDPAGLRPMGAEHSLNSCAEGAFRWNGEDVVLLSCDLLLLAKEKECLREFQAATQERLEALGQPAAGPAAG